MLVKFPGVQVVLILFWLVSRDAVTISMLIAHTEKVRILKTMYKLQSPDFRFIFILVLERGKGGGSKNHKVYFFSLTLYLLIG